MPRFVVGRSAPASGARFQAQAASRSAPGIVLALVLALSVTHCSPAETTLFLPQRLDFERARNQMVENQLRARGIRNDRVLNAMRTVPRHEFVSEPYKGLAYEDSPLPTSLGQTISQPYIVALMTELIDPKPDDRVLEVGTGSGYQSAVLAQLVREVYTIEILSELARTAVQRLARLNLNNVQVREGDGYQGWPEQAPFDAILVTAGATEIPKPLIEQLKPGGRIIIPVGSGPGSQILQVARKNPNGTVEIRDVVPVRFVPLRRE